MNIKAITIDFWNTIFDSSNNEARVAQRRQTITKELQRLGIERTEQQLHLAHKAAWNYFDVIWHSEHRTPSTQTMVEFFWKHLEIPHNSQSISIITESFAQGILDHPPVLLPGVEEALVLLAEHHHVALISDTAFSPGKILKQLMANHNIAHLFDAYSFSDETGVAKPHPTAFSTALTTLPVSPEECIHIGDIERTDIVGAKNFGMHAILFTGSNNPAVPQGKAGQSLADFAVGQWNEIPDVIASFS